MDDVWTDLLKLWVLWYSSAALFGAYIGTMLAFGTRALYRKLTKRG